MVKYYFVSLVIVVLILANFFIPPTIGSKLIVGLFNLAVLCSYLLYFKTVLPAGNVNTPLIGNSFIIQKDAIPLFCDGIFCQALNLFDICLLVSFYNGSLVVAISSILSTILSLRWTRLPSKSAPPPTFIQSCLSGRIGTILGVSHKVIKYFLMLFFFHLFVMPNLTIFFYCF